MHYYINKKVEGNKMNSITFDIQTLREIKALRAEITDALTLKQFEPCMFKTHAEFAEQVKRVSKSKQLISKADKILVLWQKLKGNK